MMQIGGFPGSPTGAGPAASPNGWVKGLTATTTGAEEARKTSVRANVQVSAVGPVGIEPTTRGLKVLPRTSQAVTLDDVSPG
jgi:hypothetical protein